MHLSAISGEPSAVTQKGGGETKTHNGNSNDNSKADEYFTGNPANHFCQVPARSSAVLYETQFM